MKTVKIMLVYNLRVKIIELTFKPIRRITGQIVEVQPAGGIHPNRAAGKERLGCIPPAGGAMITQISKS